MSKYTRPAFGGVMRDATGGSGDGGRSNGFPLAPAPATQWSSADDFAFGSSSFRMSAFTRQPPHAPPPPPSSAEFKSAPGRAQRAAADVSLSSEQRTVVSAVRAGKSVFFTGARFVWKQSLCQITFFLISYDNV